MFDEKQMPKTLLEAINYFANKDICREFSPICVGRMGLPVRDKVAVRQTFISSRLAKSGGAMTAKSSFPLRSGRSSRTHISA